MPMSELLKSPILTLSETEDQQRYNDYIQFFGPIGIQP